MSSTRDPRAETLEGMAMRAMRGTGPAGFPESVRVSHVRYSDKGGHSARLVATYRGASRVYRVRVVNGKIKIIAIAPASWA